MSVQDNLNVARKLFNVFNKHNLKEGEQYIDPSCQFVNVPFNIKVQGVEGYRKFVGGWETAFPDSRTEVTNMIANEDTITTEFTGIGTHKGVLYTSEGEIQPTGKQVSIPFCQVDKIKDGKVVQSKLYYDSLTMLSQIGVVNRKDLVPK